MRRPSRDKYIQGCSIIHKKQHPLTLEIRCPRSPCCNDSQKIESVNLHLALLEEGPPLRRDFTGGKFLRT